MLTRGFNSMRDTKGVVRWMGTVTSGRMYWGLTLGNAF